MIKMNRLICHPTRHLTRPHKHLTSLHSKISIAPTASLVSLASPPSPQSPPLHRHSRSLFSSVICHRNTTNPTICTNNHGPFGMSLLPATRRNYSTTQQLLLRNQQKQPKLAHEWIIDGQVHSGDDIISSDVAQEKEVVLFLHGLLGNAKNLRTPAKKLTERLPHLSALIVDIRGHGNSSSTSSFPPPHNFHTCSQDIFDTLQTLGLLGNRSPTAVVGHSLGGRLALQYAHNVVLSSKQQQQQQQQQQQSSSSSELALHPPKQIWVLDAVPGQPDPSVHHVLRTISSIPLPIASKSWLADTLTKDHKMDKGVAMWMASNLRFMQQQQQQQHSQLEQQLQPSPKRKQQKPLEWVFNLEIANELVTNFADQDFVPMIHDITTANTTADANATTHATTGMAPSMVNFVLAGRNKEWKDEIVSELQAIPTFGTLPSSLFQMHHLPKAGHWVHVDDLDGLMDVMVKGLGQ